MARIKGSAISVFTLGGVDISDLVASVDIPNARNVVDDTTLGDAATKSINLKPTHRMTINFKSDDAVIDILTDTTEATGKDAQKALALTVPSSATNRGYKLTGNCRIIDDGTANFQASGDAADIAVMVESTGDAWTITDDTSA